MMITYTGYLTHWVEESERNVYKRKSVSDCNVSKGHFVLLFKYIAVLWYTGSELFASSYIKSVSLLRYVTVTSDQLA